MAAREMREKLLAEIRQHKENELQRQQELANLRKVEQAAHEAEPGTVKKDKDGNIIDDPSAAAKWAKFENDAKMLIERGQEGYDSFVSAMSQVLKICRSLNEALQASNPVGTVASTAQEFVQSYLDSREFNKLMKEAKSYNNVDWDVENEAQWNALKEEAAKLGLHIEEEPDAAPGMRL